MPETRLTQPSGIATVSIDPATGVLLPPGTPGALPELIRVEDIARLQRTAPADERALNAQESFDIF